MNRLFVALLVTLLSVAYARPSSAGPGDLLFKITAPDSQPVTGFGQVLAIVDGDIMVGDPLRIGLTQRDQGRAYLFDGTTGNLKLTFDNPDPQLSDSFASSFAGGNGRVFISALALQGRVYAYSTTTGQLLHTIREPEGLNEPFGHGLAYADGQLLVSNPSYTAQSVNTIAVGRAYLFDGPTGNLVHTVANPEPKRGDLFGVGRSLAITDSRLIVGAMGDDLPGDDAPDGDNPGRVWIFNRSTGDVVTTLENPNPESELSDSFGYTVVADAVHMVVGAPDDSTAGVRRSGSIYIFDNLTGTLTHTLFSPQIERSGEFGSSVALTADGDVLVGAFGTSVKGIDRAGHAYLFDGESGRLLLDIPNPNPQMGAFGFSVAALGNRIVVGSPAEGTVYVYEAIPEPSSLVMVTPSLIGAVIFGIARRILRQRAARA